MARVLHATGSDRARTPNLKALRVGVEACHACPLWRGATHGVPGEGPARAPIMLVGEQPGDREDRSGHPFVGPAGLLLDRALAAAGVERSQVFVTNVVKHFKWVPRGKRRIHKTPDQTEIAACLDWLLAEVRIVRPRLIVCLGATAAKALLGRDFRVTVERGQRRSSPLGPEIMATVHPSSLLRNVDEAQRRADFDRFVADLRLINA